MLIIRVKKKKSSKVRGRGPLEPNGPEVSELSSTAESLAASYNYLDPTSLGLGQDQTVLFLNKLSL